MTKLIYNLNFKELFNIMKFIENNKIQCKICGDNINTNSAIDFFHKVGLNYIDSFYVLDSCNKKEHYMIEFKDQQDALKFKLMVVY